jgi:aspartyl-tRNA(Asn)/glutamyl-tRNA(Gln) amidotransferase subunit A
MADLQALGHEVSHGTLPFSIDAVAGNWHKIGNVGLSLLARAEPDFYGKVSPAFADQARAGAAISGGEYLEVLEMLFKLRSDVGEAFASMDVLATPACAAMPWPAAQAFPPIIDGRDAGPRGHAVFTGWVNGSGHPGLTVPCAPAPDGMPIGMQLVGDMGAESLLLDLAAGYEAASPWAHRWPALAME